MARDDDHRTRWADAEQLASIVRSAVRELDPQLAVYNITTTVEQISNSAAQPRLNAVALLASYIPARRATRVDPLTALRAE